MFKGLVFSLIYFVLLSISFAEEFQTGDMIFRTSKSSQAGAIFKATKSNYTHVGIIEVDERGKKWVIESVGPVQRIPFKDWVDGAVGKKIAVHRYKGLSDQQKKAVIKAAMKYEGKPYDKHFTFLDQGSSIYCSELVEMAYKEGAGIDVGKRQKLQDLNIGDELTMKLIRDRWKTHPACKGGKAKSAQECLEIIKPQEMITPVGLTKDNQVEEVYSDFGLVDRMRGRFGLPPARR